MDIPENDVVFLFLKKSMLGEDITYDRTDFCRLTNHSDTPNLDLIEIKNDIFVISNQDIETNEEFTIDYSVALEEIAGKRKAGINEKILRITPGYESFHIPSDSHKNLIDEIQNIKGL